MKSKARKVGGLVRYDTGTGRTRQFHLDREITSAWITSILIDTEHVWVGTYGGGLDVLDKEAQTWSNISTEHGLPSNYIKCLASDDEYLWIGTGRFREGAVARLDRAMGSIHTFLPTDHPKGSEPPTCYVHNMMTVGGRVWCALGQSGAAMYDKEANTWKHFSKSQTGRSFHTFECLTLFNDRLWFGSREGNKAIYSCDPNGENWRSISTNEGLPPEGGKFVGIFDMTCLDDRLVLGSYGVVLMDASRAFEAFKYRSGREWHFAVTKLLPAGEDLWVATRKGIRIMKNP